MDATLRRCGVGVGGEGSTLLAGWVVAVLHLKWAGPEKGMLWGGLEGGGLFFKGHCRPAEALPASDAGLWAAGP